MIKTPEQSQSYIGIGYKKYQTIENNMYLVWAPIPLGLGLMSDLSDGNWSAVEWLLGCDASISSKKVSLTPTFTGKNIFMIKPSIAYWTRLSYGFTLPVFDQPWAWRGEATTGPRFGLLPKLVLETSFVGSISNVLFARLADSEQQSLSSPIKVAGLKTAADFQASTLMLISGEYRLIYVDPLWDFVQRIQVSATLLIYIFGHWPNF